MRSYDIQLLKEVGHTIGSRQWIHRWITLPFVPYLNLKVEVGGDEVQLLDVTWFPDNQAFVCSTRRDESVKASPGDWPGWSTGLSGDKPAGVST